MNRNRLRAQIKEHEGFRSKPYVCSEGKLTIGYGRNLDAKGISEREADFLLTLDLNKAEADARHMIPTFNQHSALRQEVLVEMVFQMGLAGVLRFKKMIHALRNKDYREASVQMLQSRWAEQTPNRATKLAIQMRDGE